MEIEILVVPDCPNAEPAAELVGHSLDEASRTDVTVTTRVITTQDEAEHHGFTGSPTLLVDGRDPFAEPGRSPGLACRIYRTPDGPAGLPALDQLRRVLTVDVPDTSAPHVPGAAENRDEPNGEDHVKQSGDRLSTEQLALLAGHGDELGAGGHADQDCGWSLNTAVRMK
ncbi:hypothetical protein [Streptomyces sp. WM6378]|uniref:hypothetical protein n=1 Tax=Streptomyces sp. WM6378 TaxID=1415557 RepID=UPI0007C76B05|nr:hypothetical protein [Streptomyces sp. WM6378]